MNKKLIQWKLVDRIALSKFLPERDAIISERDAARRELSLLRGDR